MGLNFCKELQQHTIIFDVDTHTIIQALLFTSKTLLESYEDMERYYYKPTALFLESLFLQMGLLSMKTRVTAGHQLIM